MSVEYHRPAGVGEAIALLAMSDGNRALAGGTDLIVAWRRGEARVSGFVDLSAVREMKGIKDAGPYVEIGATATHSEIASSRCVRKHAPALARACLSIGGVQIQNRGTIGGNVMNASPAGDTLPVLMAHEAEFLVQNLKGERWVACKEFFTGYRTTAAGQDELLSKVRIAKADSKERSEFYKVGQRRAQAISKVSMCVRARVRHGGIEWIKIALGSVAEVPLRARGTEAMLQGQVITDNLIERARASLVDEIAPIDDIRSTADYRSFAAGGMLARYLRAALTEPGLFRIKRR